MLPIREMVLGSRPRDVEHAPDENTTRKKVTPV
jgi:hypothetical protein